MRPGKTARYSGDVDLLAGSFLVETGAFQPTEKRPTGAAGERYTSFGLDFSRRLANQHRPRIPRVRRNRRYARAKRAAATRQQGVAVSVKSDGCSDSSHRISEGAAMYYTSRFPLLPQVARRVERGYHANRP